MKAHREDFDLATELHALRPAPRPQFTAELDTRAAAGFPSRGAGTARLERPREAAARLADRFRVSPRRLLAPAAGTALAAVAIATVVVINGESGSTAPAGHGGPSSVSGAGSAEALSGASKHGIIPQMLEFSRELPKPARLSKQKNFNGSFNAGGTVERSSSEVGSASAPAAGGGSGPFASQAGRRDIERAAEMVLGAEAPEVREAAAKVFATVHTYDGIVLRSSIEDGDEGDAGAQFELLIPSAKLGDALASFSRIAEVRSRHESTADVTARTIGLGERLQDARARVESLLAQLAAADTDAERAAAEAELRSARFRVASLRSRLADLQRRTNFSRVSLRIESGKPSATGEPGGSWGVGDAIGDAGHILEVAAGIALVGLAILTPLALIALVAWLAHRTWLRRRREHALG